MSLPGGTRLNSCSTVSFLAEFAHRFHREEAGQDLLEYALLLLAVCSAVIAGSNSLAAVLSTAIASLSGKVAGLVS